MTALKKKSVSIFWNCTSNRHEDHYYMLYKILNQTDTIILSKRSNQIYTPVDFWSVHFSWSLVYKLTVTQFHENVSRKNSKH